MRVPLIIFDDFKAIDHDHHSVIRRARFESERFRQTRIIVTCPSLELPRPAPHAQALPMLV